MYIYVYIFLVHHINTAANTIIFCKQLLYRICCINMKSELRCYNFKQSIIGCLGYNVPYCTPKTCSEYNSSPDAIVIFYPYSPTEIHWTRSLKANRWNLESSLLPIIISRACIISRSEFVGPLTFYPKTRTIVANFSTRKSCKRLGIIFSTRAIVINDGYINSIFFRSTLVRGFRFSTSRVTIPLCCLAVR
jgi:hypothetical protein